MNGIDLPRLSLKAWTRLRYLPTMLTSVGGIALSLTIFLVLRNWEWRQIQADFRLASRTEASAIEEAIKENCHVLNAIQGLYAVGGDVSREQFRTFVGPMRARMVGVQAVAWAPRIAGADRAKYEAAARTEGIPDFSFTEREAAGEFVKARDHDEYLPVYFIEPPEDNQRVFGFDLASNTQRRRWCEKARDLGKPVATMRLALIHKPEQNGALLIFLPVYRKGLPVNTVEQRRENLQGLVIGAFRLPELVQEALAGLPPMNIDVRLFDGAAPEDRQVLCLHRSENGNGREVITWTTAYSRGSLQYVADLAAVSGSGRLVFAPQRAFIAKRRTWQPWAILGACLLISAFGNASLFASTRRAAHNERLFLQRADQLQQSEERYRSLVENIDLGITLIDPDYTVVALNAAQSRFFDKPADKLIGRTCYREFEKRESPCPHCPGKQAMATGRPAEAETVGVRDDGARISVHIHAFPVLNNAGEVTGFIELVEDVTKYRQTERALRTSETLLRNTFEAIPDLLTVHDRDYRVVLSNWHGYESFGAETSQTGPRCYECYRQRDKPCEGCHLPQVFETGQATVVEHYEPDTGNTKEVSAYPVFDENGQVALVTEYVRDITARREAERALKEYALALEASNKNFEEVSLAAQAATRAKSAFLANMSHEIRTPLTAILGYADLLLCASMPPENHQAAAIIKRNGEYLLRIINDILDLSRIEADKLHIECVACSPCHILADLTSLMKVSADAKGLPLEVEYDGPLPETIVSDPIRLRQILLNLIGNAIKFTEAGMVQVVARLLQPATDQPLLQFEVVDSGIGMSDEQVRRLFQPFSQADTSTTRRFGGSGLGLLISKRLAVALGGDITVHSVPGEGSTFCLTVATGPLQGVGMVIQPELVSRQRGVTTESAAGVRLAGRILLAEDGPDNQRLFSHLLRKAGADVTLVQNGQEAVDIVLATQGSKPFDLVLMDIQMPVMDGYDATLRLRKEGYTGPIIALTAHAMSQDVQRCLDAGCNLHLSKPIDRDSLLNAVMGLLHPASPPVTAHEPQPTPG